MQSVKAKYSNSFHSFQDLNRQVVQTNNATVKIPELEFETPPNKGGKAWSQGYKTFIMRNSTMHEFSNAH